jgi:hypothetical protein
MVGAIMRNFHGCMMDGWLWTERAVHYVYALCDILHEIRNHSHFRMDFFKFNVLCKLLPWKEFTDFLQQLANPGLCDGNDFCDEHGFITVTLREMAKSIQENNMDGMNEHYSRVLSNHLPRGFVTDRAQISEFVCDQLSITSVFGQVPDSPINSDDEEEDDEEE